MHTFHKVVPCVIRECDRVSEILAFHHPPPLRDKQIAKGTVEVGEDLEAAATRELFEETGVSNCTIKEKLGSFEIFSPGGPHGDLPIERQIWHVIILQPLYPLPEDWKHQVTGDGVDSGMIYEFFWHPIRSKDDGFHPKFQTLFDFICTQFLDKGL